MSRIRRLEEQSAHWAHRHPWLWALGCGVTTALPIVWALTDSIVGGLVGALVWVLIVGWSESRGWANGNYLRRFPIAPPD